MISYFGIRHHGAGTCRNLLSSLKQLKPDIILLEGPPEASKIIFQIKENKIKPPVAILSYEVESVSNAVFFPFAEFTPEWQTIMYAIKNKIDFKFIDLPLTHSLAIKNTINEDYNPEISDPLNCLAKLENLPNGETWWNVHVEQAANSENIFPAIENAIYALREALTQNTSKFDLIRETWMRKILSETIKENYNNIAVVCGAWHIPGIKEPNSKLHNLKLIKKLPSVEVESTWIPWTYSRLTQKSGYGAGIEYPGWYQHLYQHPDDDGRIWILKAAKILRKNNFTISTAHIIDTVKLNAALCKIRNLSRPTLHELNDSIITILGAGKSETINYLQDDLLIGNKLGSVPNEISNVPLLKNFQVNLKKLRLQLEDNAKEIKLDLRKKLDLKRSIFLHRLKIMKINWAEEKKTTGLGTFKESWILNYSPQINIQIIECGIFGNTIKQAAKEIAILDTNQAKKIEQLTSILNEVIPSDLLEIVNDIAQKLDIISAQTCNILELMDSVPSLTEIILYGNVRNLDYSEISKILSVFIVRITNSGIRYCENTDENLSENIIQKLDTIDISLTALKNKHYDTLWINFLKKLCKNESVNALISGFSHRLLYDKKIIEKAEMIASLSFYTSQNNKTKYTALWFEGFFSKSGIILIMDDDMWKMFDNWIQNLEYNQFMDLLPIIRRTFAKYSNSERIELSQKAIDNSKPTNQKYKPFDETSAKKVLPLIENLLGL